jgi:hypothetical protein
MTLSPIHRLPVALASVNPSLRDQIDEITDLAWTAISWTLRDVIYGLESGLDHSIYSPGLTLLLDVDKVRRHLELAYIYAYSSGDDTSQWSRKSLLAELRAAMERFEGVTTPYEQRFMVIFGQIVGALASLDQASGDYASNAVIDLVAYADVCFDIMTELEG